MGYPFPLSTSHGYPMSRLRRVFARLRRQPARPWVYERLATPEEIAELTKTDLRRAA